MRTPLLHSSAAARCLAVLGLLICATRADAKAAYAGKAEMLKRAEAVAVVDVVIVEKAEVKGNHWTYRQRAVAKVRNTLKGELPGEKEELFIHGDEDFICAQCHFEPGRYLVFLTRDGGLWAGCNWHLSVRPVKTDAEGREWVDWYADEKTIELKPRLLPDVVAEVTKELKAAADPKAAK
jgi:hypothetical protein